MKQFLDMLSLIMITVIITIIIFMLVKFFSIDSMSKPHRVVVFDLDETLGSFSELGMFWDALEKILGTQNEDHFFEVVDLYPEFLRPKILRILKYLKDMKKEGLCHKVMIYTNNQGPRTWANMITHYFNEKTGAKIFDHIIAAFKVRGEIVEVSRTSHGKSVSDLIKCTKLPSETQICFLDDQFHPDMRADNVYYINVKPYTYSIRFDTMAYRYYNRFVPAMNKADFIRKILSHMGTYRYTHFDKQLDEKAVDEVISKQIIIHLNNFFMQDKKSTRKHRDRTKISTRKHR